MVDFDYTENADLFEEELEQLEPVEEVKQETIKLGKVYNCPKLNVRKEPKLTSEIICEIAQDTEVMIDEEESTSEFYKIYTVSGAEGYCMKSYILENSQQ